MKLFADCLNAYLRSHHVFTYTALLVNVTQRRPPRVQRLHNTYELDKKKHPYCTLHNEANAKILTVSRVFLQCSPGRTDPPMYNREESEVANVVEYVCRGSLWAAVTPLATLDICTSHCIATYRLTSGTQNAATGKSLQLKTDGLAGDCL